MSVSLRFCSRAKTGQEAQALPIPVRHPVNKQLLFIRESMDKYRTVINRNPRKINVNIYMCVYVYNLAFFYIEPNTDKSPTAFPHKVTEALYNLERKDVTPAGCHSS